MMDVAKKFLACMMDGWMFSEAESDRITLEIDGDSWVLWMDMPLFHWI